MTLSITERTARQVKRWLELRGGGNGAHLAVKTSRCK